MSENNTQLTSAIGYDTSNMRFSEPVLGSIPDSKPAISYRRINITTINPDGTEGELIIPTDEVFSYGVGENTNIETGSPAVLLKNLLLAKGYDVATFDPHLNPANTWQCQTDYIYFIGCKHDCFENYEFNDSCIVIDPHRYIKKENCKNLIHVGICH